MQQIIANNKVDKFYKIFLKCADTLQDVRTVANDNEWIYIEYTVYCYLYTENLSFFYMCEQSNRRDMNRTTH